MQEARVVGLMSGTSMDGLDIALCVFRKRDRWEFEIAAAETLAYPEEWQTALAEAHTYSGERLLRMHADYGRFLGGAVTGFLQRHGTNAELVASHGHTVFHQPGSGFTFQAGCGSTLAAVCGLPVVHDFRASDVALGGQGAPLVPIGDRLLFGDQAACLNLGGIANISFEHDGKRIAYDISPCNLLLNEIARRCGKPYDEGGMLAATGTVDTRLLEDLEKLGYYRLPAPKSLGREDIERDFLPLLSGPGDDAGKLATVCCHIARRIAAAVSEIRHEGPVLVTGGGAFNHFLLDQLRSTCGREIQVGDPVTINFKEALVFAFLGLLRMRGEVNVLSSVTGACTDHSAGSVSLP